jgi:hypothetical protein
MTFIVLMNLIMTVVYSNDCTISICSDDMTSTSKVNCDSCLNCTSLNLNTFVSTLSFVSISTMLSDFKESTSLRPSKWINQIDRPPINA